MFQMFGCLLAKSDPHKPLFRAKQALVLGRPGIRNLPISVVSRSGCRLLYKYEKSGEGGGGREEKGTNVVKNSGYFPACNAVVMLKIGARPGYTRSKGCSLAQETNKNNKVASKLEQGLNFTVKVDFCFCNDDFCKNPEGKKAIFIVLP